jgi:hypothetical protein
VNLQLKERLELNLEVVHTERDQAQQMSTFRVKGLPMMEPEEEVPEE